MPGPGRAEGGGRLFLLPFDLRDERLDSSDAKGRPMKTRAMKMPDGVNATLIAEAPRASADPAVRRIERRQRDARNGGGQGEGQVDDGIDDPPARENRIASEPRR